MNPVELLEKHGLDGERLVTAVMEMNGCSRGEAITQIRWAHGETRGDQRLSDEGAVSPEP